MRSAKPTLDTDRLRYFAFDLLLPTATSPEFNVVHDIAEVLGFEYQQDAVEAFETAFANEAEDMRGEIDVDREGSCAFISATSPASALRVCNVLNALATKEHRRPMSQRRVREILRLLESVPIPVAVKWKRGDVFAVPLGDGTFSYGQVLGPKRPTSALLELRTESCHADASAPLRHRVIAIIHIGSDLLDEGTLRVIGHSEPVVPYDSGPHGNGFSVGNRSHGGARPLVRLAEAWWGIRPWDESPREGAAYLDRMLMYGVERPATAWLARER